MNGTQRKRNKNIRIGSRRIKETLKEKSEEADS